MSKNITIQEGGIAKQLTADKLKTNLVGGGACLWVPEDETTLGTKVITENGTYKATDDGYYGYSEVTVSGIGTATGTGPDGETHSYTEDGEGGITDTVIPDSIAVVTPPTVTAYADGATIDFSGMVVKAYLKSGSVWTDAAHPNGIIPISELVLPVTAADSSSSSKDEWSDGNGVVARLITYTPHTDIAPNKPDKIVYVSEALGESNGYPAMLGASSNGFMASFYATRMNGYLYVKGVNGNENLNGYEYHADEEKNYKYSLFMGSSIKSGQDFEKFYKGPKDLYEWATGIPESTSDPRRAGELQPLDAKQTIPVQWIRPGDYSTLESSFNITVT